MKFSVKEKEVLYAYACLDYHNTVTRLKWLTALAVDPEAKRWMLAGDGRVPPSEATVTGDERRHGAGRGGPV